MEIKKDNTKINIELKNDDELFYHPLSEGIKIVKFLNDKDIEKIIFDFSNVDHIPVTFPAFFFMFDKIVKRNNRTLQIIVKKPTEEFIKSSKQTTNNNHYIIEK